MDGLHPTARLIIDTARSILVDDGFQGLTLSNLVERAQVNNSSIKYHFGDKAGLVAAVIDSLIHDDCIDLIQETRQLEGEQRVHAYVRGVLRMAQHLAAYKSFYEVIPEVLREPSLRERMAVMYEWYFEWTMQVLDLEDSTASGREWKPVARLLVAITDGIALQALMDPTTLSPDPPHSELERLLTLLLETAQPS